MKARSRMIIQDKRIKEVTTMVHKKQGVLVGVMVLLVALFLCFAGGQTQAATGTDKVVIWLPMGKGNVENWDSDPILQEIERVTNTEVKMVNMEWETFFDNLMASIANRELPDIVGVTEPSKCGILNEWARSGVLAAYEGDVAKAAPNVIAEYKKNPMLSELKVDGKIYFQPISWGDGVYPNMGLLHVRKDLLDKYGMEPPETFEDFFKYLEVAKVNGDGRLIFQGQEGVGPAINAFAGAYGLPWRGWVKKDSNYEYYAIQPDMKKALLLFRKMFTKSLVSPKVWELDADTARTTWVSGKASAGIFNGGGHIGRMQNDMDLVGKGAKEWLLPAPLLESTGKRGYTGEPMFWGTGWLGGMKHNNPVAAARVINFLISDEGYKLTTIGIEGRDYVVENGEIKFLPQRTKDGFPTVLGDTGAHPLAAGIVSWQPQKWQDWQLLYGKEQAFKKWYKNMWENQGKYQTKTYGVITTTPKWDDFIATSEELVTRAFVNIVEATSEEEASALFDKFVSDWLKAGGAMAQKEMSENLSKIDSE